MANEHETSEKGKKRKKKRSQMQMAKKFARRRNHGSDIDSDTYQYMVRILELMRGEFPTFEEKLIFVNNVYEQTVGHEVEYAQNQIGSRVMDSLLNYANLSTIQRLVEAFGSSLRPLSSDRFASHVLQKIIIVCADRGNKDPSKQQTADSSADSAIQVDESEAKLYNDIVFKLSKYLINNIEEFVSDTYANHLLRTVVECLAGLIDKTESNDRKKMTYGSRRKVIPEYKNLLFQACSRLQQWPQFLEFGRDELTSGLVQSILYSLKDTYPALLEAYIKKITNECFKPGEGQRSNVFDAECSSRLLEACLAVADTNSFDEIYEQYFSKNLKELSLTESTNFSVQRLLDHCSSKEVFEGVFEEISACVPEILSKGYNGVLASLANACLRLQTKQGAFVTALLKALHCETNERQQKVVLCIASLKTWEQLNDLQKQNTPKLFINLHGSLTVQAVLNFNKPIKLVNSLLETNGEDLLNLFSDPKGSRIVDAFMSSKYIGEKSREKLAKKLRGCWAQLATSTHGSRSLEQVWQWAGMNQRTMIMEELAAVGESLRSTKSGQIISSKLNVPLFARNRNDWTEALGKEDKTKTLFADILGGSARKNK
ncbi:nucleolar protein 9 [Halictus rubicundus]|uniref:nucleolar protein 9 n=1 Tax=Halictus rubicundus TaxID=77578 RepID=UPI0040370E15